MHDEALAGKTAIVIGASSGIGLATANLFADAGARVHAAARRREAIAEGAGEERVSSGSISRTKRPSGEPSAR
jgi:NAD(P)-dependent dehydrogenase (short-subunit alcohol dehydrogenase family)